MRGEVGRIRVEVVGPTRPLGSAGRAGRSIVGRATEGEGGGLQGWGVVHLVGVRGLKITGSGLEGIGHRKSTAMGLGQVVGLS